jgi:hypothetical protein
MLICSVVHFKWIHGAGISGQVDCISLSPSLSTRWGFLVNWIYFASSRDRTHPGISDILCMLLANAPYIFHTCNASTILQRLPRWRFLCPPPPSPRMHTMSCTNVTTAQYWKNLSASSYHLLPLMSTFLPYLHTPIPHCTYLMCQCWYLCRFQGTRIPDMWYYISLSLGCSYRLTSVPCLIKYNLCICTYVSVSVCTHLWMPSNATFYAVCVVRLHKN